METDYKRLNRLTAILNLLQAKRLVTAPALSEKFGVSIRTIYRDIRTLEQSGVPILVEEGKGYTLMEGYRLPPVSFTENEALALITTEQLLRHSKDASLIEEFESAINKIKSVLSYSNKSLAELLSKRVFFGKNLQQVRTSDVLIGVQRALTQFKLVEIDYAKENGDISKRIIEPYLLYNGAAEDWVLAAYCRLRGDFRSFRLDRIRQIKYLDTTFPPHPITVEQYLKKYVFRPE